MDILNQVKRFAPLLLIVVVGIVLYFTLKEDNFSTDNVTNEADVIAIDEQLFETNPPAEIIGEEASDESEAKVIVDIKGEVKTPGVYELTIDDRIKTAIERAGGFTSKADEQQINLAQKLHDEMVIYVPKEGEAEPSLPIVASSSGSGGMTSTGDGASDLIQVNSATIDELTRLQGIGPAKAQAIIDYRDEHGPFQQVEDLLEVSGIGEKTLDTIREQIIIP